MLSLSRISKQYGRQLLFVDASFQLNPGETVGLVGPNGSGKTTLFRLITGEEVPDEGDVSIPKRLTIAYFRQDVEESSGRSVLDEAILGSGRLGDLHHELEQLNHAMSDPDQADNMDRILERFGAVQEEYEHLGGYALEAQAREVLHGLGFDDAIAEYDGERTVVFKLVAGDRVKEFGRFVLPIPIWRGVYEEGKQYQQHDEVTWGGSVFQAIEDTSAKPGLSDKASRAWVLKVKRGAEGPKGPKGEKGDVGERGPQGPQGVRWS